jgi:hypothetical protein
MVRISIWLRVSGRVLLMYSVRTSSRPWPNIRVWVRVRTMVSVGGVVLGLWLGFELQLCWVRARDRDKIRI